MRYFYLFLSIILIVAPSIGFCDEYFGEFPDKLKGVFLTDAKPRPKFKLESEFRFKDPNGLLWVVPSEKEVDGASIPQVFWSFIGGPFEGKYINASVIHDYYCDTKSRTAHDTHRNFYYGMKVAKVPSWKAKFMYWAVATFGPDWKIEKRIVFDSICKKIGIKHVCSQVPKEVELTVTKHSIDLEDPLVLAAVMSKANTVARSLKTSNGDILDSAVSGQIIASLENISTSSNNYRNLFVSKSFLSQPEALGVLSQWQTDGGQGIKPWSNNKVPSMNDVVTLNPSNIDKITEESKEFKVDIANQALLKSLLILDSLESTSTPNIE